MSHDHEVADHSGASRRLTERRSADVRSAPVVRPSHAATAASMLHLQRLAGNAAVQRVVGVDDAAAGPAAAAPTSEAQASAPAGATGAPGAAGNTIGDGASPVTITAPTVNLQAPMVQADGVLRAQTIVADSVIASNYTPGAGNVF